MLLWWGVASGHAWERSAVVGYVGVAVTVIGGGWGLVWRRIEGYREEARSAEGRARAEVRVRNEGIE